MFLASLIAAGNYFYQGDMQFAVLLCILRFSPRSPPPISRTALFSKENENSTLIPSSASRQRSSTSSAYRLRFLGWAADLAHSAYSITAFVAAAACYSSPCAFTIHRSPTREMISYGWKLTFIGFLAPIVTQIDKIIVASSSGAADLAVYTIATVSPNKITISIKNWVGIGFPNSSIALRRKSMRLFIDVCSTAFSLALSAPAPTFSRRPTFSNIFFPVPRCNLLLTGLCHQFDLCLPTATSASSEAHNLPNRSFSIVSRKTSSASPFLCFWASAAASSALSGRISFTTFSALINIAVWRFRKM